MKAEKLAFTTAYFKNIFENGKLIIIKRFNYILP
jgi:hypothetical protein